MISKVGDDLFGEFVLKDLQRLGVARHPSFSKASDSSRSPFSRLLIKMPIAVVNARHNNLHALMPFLSSIPSS